MDQQDSATYIEEFISSTELLPNDIRRNFELIRELDRNAIDATRKCEEAEVNQQISALLFINEKTETIY